MYTRCVPAVSARLVRRERAAAALCAPFKRIGRLKDPVQNYVNELVAL